MKKVKNYLKAGFLKKNIKRAILIIIPFIIFTSFNISPVKPQLNDDFDYLIQKFKNGLLSNDDFEKLYEEFNNLENKISDELKNNSSDIELKNLLNEVEAVTDFIGEIGPDGRNFDLTNQKKQIALKKLGITEIIYNNKDYCLPISKIELWNNKYVCYLLVNNYNCLFKYVYKIKKSTGNNSGNGGVDKLSSRELTQHFGNYPITILSLTCEKTYNCK